MDTEYDDYDDIYIEGLDGEYYEIPSYEVNFIPSRRTNLLGHPAEWRAELPEYMFRDLVAIADEWGEGLKVEWGCFMCPARIDNGLLYVNTSGVW